MWELRGVPRENVVILHPRILDILVPTRLDAFVEREMTRLKNRLNHPITVHSFSNGGFILLSTLLASDHDQHISSKVEKFVFDSAPAPVTPEMTALAIINVLFGQVDAENSFVFTTLRFFCNLYLQVPGIKRRNTDLWRFWQNSAPVRPILSFLSQTDPLIDVEAAKIFLSQQVRIWIAEVPMTPILTLYMTFNQ